MSMRDYGYNDYGIVLSDYEVLYAASICMREDYPDNKIVIEEDNECVVVTDENGEETVYEHCDCLDYLENIVLSVGNFTGDCRKILDAEYTSDDFSDDTLNYIPLLKSPSFFEKAYDSFEDMVEKHKAEYAKYLPDDFDWKNKLVHIVGSTWG